MSDNLNLAPLPSDPRPVYPLTHYGTTSVSGGTTIQTWRDANDDLWDIGDGYRECVGHVDPQSTGD